MDHCFHSYVKSSVSNERVDVMAGMGYGLLAYPQPCQLCFLGWNLWEIMKLLLDGEKEANDQPLDVGVPSLFRETPEHGVPMDQWLGPGTISNHTLMMVYWVAIVMFLPLNFPWRRFWYIDSGILSWESYRWCPCLVCSSRRTASMWNLKPIIQSLKRGNRLGFLPKFGHQGYGGGQAHLLHWIGITSNLDLVQSPLH